MKEKVTVLLANLDRHEGWLLELRPEGMHFVWDELERPATLVFYPWAQVNSVFYEKTPEHFQGPVGDFKRSGDSKFGKSVPGAAITPAPVAQPDPAPLAIDPILPVEPVSAPEVAPAPAEAAPVAADPIPIESSAPVSAS